MKANMFRNVGAAVVLLGGMGGASLAQSFVITGALVVWAFAYPDAAAALEWNLNTGEVTDIPEVDGPGADDAPSPCGTWGSPPKVVIHVLEFFGSGRTIDDEVQMQAAIADVNEQFNLVGATTARVTELEYSIEPFTFGSWFQDDEPTIHVGFTTDPDVAGEELTGPVSGCQYDEAHIQFNVTDTTWDFGTPADSGEDYYDVAQAGPRGRYFRPVYLHELLHAFGLKHSADTYSFLNAGDRPWANRPEVEAIRPLPADVRALRDLYPADGARTEVAILNTWFDPDMLTDALIPAATQRLLCQPSLGTDWNPFYYPTCGTGGPDSGSTKVCEGDTLRTRYVLANYSTERMTFWAELWFSVDETWDSNDVQAPSQLGFDVAAAHSALQANTWTVPSLTPGVDYHPIVRVVSMSDTDHDGTYEGSTTRTDWIPLPGTVDGC